MLKFEVSKQKLIKISLDIVVADSRNYLTALFTFSEDWDEYTPKVATFNRIDKENCCYSVIIEDGQCVVPWEVLVDKGTMEVSVQGGDLITTNPVAVNILRSGAKNGLAPTESSPSVYKYIVDMAENIKNSVAKFLIGDFNDVDINAKSVTADNITINKKANILEIVSDFVTSKYNSVKNKLKFNSNGWDLSVESTDTNGNTYKHQIKTSNSKMQINGADMEFNSDKNERHNVNGNYQVYAVNDIDIQKEQNTVFKSTDSKTGIYFYNTDTDMNYVEVDSSNTRIGASNDIQLNSNNNIRNNLHGTYEVINGGPNMIRLIQKNKSENKSVKVYLGSDHVTIGVDDTEGKKDSDYLNSEIVSGFNITKNSIDVIGNINIPFTEIDRLIRSITLDTIGLIYNEGDGNSNIYNFGEYAGNNWEKPSDNVKLLICENGLSIMYGIGKTTDTYFSNEDQYYEDSGFHGLGDSHPEIKEVYIQYGITRLGDGLLQGCTNLEYVYIPDSVISIGDHVFYLCEKLKSIVIPSSVTEISNYAFNNDYYHCLELETITINKPENSISGAPWGATNATVVWNDTEE